MREKVESFHAHHVVAYADAPPAEDTEVVVSIEKRIPFDFGEALMAVRKGRFTKSYVFNDSLQFAAPVFGTSNAALAHRDVSYAYIGGPAALRPLACEASVGMLK
jgi:hypothetical protein